MGTARGSVKPDSDSQLEATARRALRDKLSVEIPYLEQLRTFSGASRDPRGWSIGVPRDQVYAVVRSKVNAVEWSNTDHAARALAFDHGRQLDQATQALREKVDRHALPLHLLPERFTLTELQRRCEAILGRPKGVFRRRLRTSQDIVEIPEASVRGAQRPAQLYRARVGFQF